MSKANNRFFFALTALFVSFFVWMYLAKVDVTTVANGIVVPRRTSPDWARWSRER